MSARGPASTTTSRRRWPAALLAVLVLLAGAGCRTWGRGPDHRPVSEEEGDSIYLRLAVNRLIYEALSESNPEALLRFFAPASRDQVDCKAFYRQLMGAAPGVYQPRFRDMETLELTYAGDRTRAHTRLMLECVDRRPGTDGTGRFIPLELDWIKRAGKWYLAPPATTSPAVELVPR